MTGPIASEFIERYKAAHERIIGAGMAHIFSVRRLKIEAARSRTLQTRQQPLPADPPSLRQAEAIIRIVVDVCQVCRRDLNDTFRLAHIVRARHIAFYLIRSHTPLSTPAIGRLFNKHHATILHGIHCVETKRRRYEPWLSRAQGMLEHG